MSNNTIKIHVLHTGEVGVDPAVPNRSISRNPIAYTGLFRNSKRRIWLPVSAYLIEHPKGIVLIDTGWSNEVRIDEKKHLGWKVYLASKARLPKGQAVDEQLATLGIKPKNLDYVLFSHLDADHISGVKMVKDAKKIMCSEEEWKGANSGNARYVTSQWEGVNVETFKFNDYKVGPLHKAFDVFGDGTVLMVYTPGHAQGSCVTLVQNNGKFVLLTGDTGYAPLSWEKIKLPGPVYDKNAMKVSLRWVQEMSRKENCVEVLANHDPEVKPHVIEL